MLCGFLKGEQSFARFIETSVYSCDSSPVDDGSYISEKGCACADCDGAASIAFFYAAVVSCVFTP